VRGNSNVASGGQNLLEGKVDVSSQVPPRKASLTLPAAGLDPRLHFADFSQGTWSEKEPDSFFSSSGQKIGILLSGNSRRFHSVAALRQYGILHASRTSDPLRRILLGSTMGLTGCKTKNRT
jgi:hypothetical protein